MGVPGLWDVLNNVGKSTSIVRLTVVGGFEPNRSRKRAYRIGVDASIWFHHASFSKEGENPETRGLFFRLIYLAKLPILPLFVFDGRKRPKIKARGEAEAELAYLNQNGHIDAVMTDDCDAFLFGAHTVIKSVSSKSSGNKNNLAKNSNNKVDKYHTMVYKVGDIQNNPSISLSRGGLILFALLSGGDYHKGVDRVGKKIALGLARCGFGTELLEAYENLRGYKAELGQFLQQWRMRVNLELKENSQGHLLHRTSLSLPDDFPNLDVLEYYANPIHSGNSSQGLGSIALRDQKNLNLAKIAQLCEQYFEWGYRDKILERFKTLVWPCATMHILRRAALEIDQQHQNEGGTSSKTQVPSSRGDVGTPASLVQRYLGCSSRENRNDGVFVNKGSGTAVYPIVNANPLICKITGKRQHVSTDGLLEYKIEISLTQLVEIVKTGIKGTRQAPRSAEESIEPKKANKANLLPLWVPATMLSIVHPSMVKEFVDKESESSNKSKRQGKAKEQTHTTNSTSVEQHMQTISQQPQPRSIPKIMTVRQCDVIRTFEPVRTVVLDPWFTSAVLTSQTYAKKKCSGFFFTSPNPDCGDHAENSDTQALNDDYDSEANLPLTKFDRICDGILTKKGRKQ